MSMYNLTHAKITRLVSARIVKRKPGRSPHPVTGVPAAKITEGRLTFHINPPAGESLAGGSLAGSALPRSTYHVTIGRHYVGHITPDNVVRLSEMAATRVAPATLWYRFRLSIGTVRGVRRVRLSHGKSCRLVEGLRFCLNTYVVLNPTPEIEYIKTDKWSEWSKRHREFSRYLRLTGKLQSTPLLDKSEVYKPVNRIIWQSVADYIMQGDYLNATFEVQLMSWLDFRNLKQGDEGVSEATIKSWHACRSRDGKKMDVYVGALTEHDPIKGEVK